MDVTDPSAVLLIRKAKMESLSNRSGFMLSLSVANHVCTIQLYSHTCDRASSSSLGIHDVVYEITLAVCVGLKQSCILAG